MWLKLWAHPTQKKKKVRHTETSEASSSKALSVYMYVRMYMRMCVCLYKIYVSSACVCLCCTLCVSWRRGAKIINVHRSNTTAADFRPNIRYMYILIVCGCVCVLCLRVHGLCNLSLRPLPFIFLSPCSPSSATSLQPEKGKNHSGGVSQCVAAAARRTPGEHRIKVLYLDSIFFPFVADIIMTCLNVRSMKRTLASKMTSLDYNSRLGQQWRHM